MSLNYLCRIGLVLSSGINFVCKAILVTLQLKIAILLTRKFNFYVLFFLRSIAHFFTQIVLSVHMLVNLWTIAEYHVKLWLMGKKSTTIS